MKRIFWISAVAVTVFAIFSLDAIAQPGGGQGQGQRQIGAFGQMGGATPPGQLLRNEEVVKMLTLTDAQTTALNETLRPQRDQGQAGGAAPGGQRVPGQGGATMTAEERAVMVAQQRQRTTEQWAGINRVLNAEQQTKFKEIYFQANNGLNAMQLDDWMLAVVDLTAEQKEQIAKLVADRAATARPMGGDGQQLSVEERTAQRTAFVNQVTAILTPEQKAKAERLTEGASALRTTLGIPAAGQPGQRGQGGTGGSGFIPGSGAWQPGQGAPTPAGRGQGIGAGGRQGGARGGGN